MSELLINQFLAELDRVRKFSGSLSESTVREAFKDLLKAWSRQKNLQFLAELAVESNQKTRVIPDGTILHEMRVPLGYWEAKDTADDLDEEISKKFAKGYPQDNIVFENSHTAVLIQNRQEVMRAAMTDVREMLIQHILTEEIFSHVFNDGEFHRENNIAKALYGLESQFFTGAVKRETLHALQPYYAAINSNAALITSHHEKQTFLKVIYENFYKVYNPKAADRLGVVYTPNEIVRFMIEGADWLTQKHFHRSLIDRDVQILDPATGTGTFICELLEHFRGQPDKLAHKYKHELHANEVAILPYYVANLNIEATYAAISGQFAEYPSLCFVDTLDNVAALGIYSGHQHDLFGAMSDENIARVKRQNEKTISVIIGNPPYNANQQNENDNNKNREYARIDQRIKDTYIKASTAQKTKLYDMYARFFRWASDRLNKDGVLAFVTNRSFIDSRTFDGFRKTVAKDFAEIWLVDLKGNARNSGEQRRREGGNIFDDQIKVGVAISFFVKKQSKQNCLIRYQAVDDYTNSEEKRAFVASKPLSERRFQLLEPDKKGNWLNLTDNDWEDLLPLGDKKTKAAKSKGQDRTIFKVFSLGVVTNRDEWAYGFSRQDVGEKMNLLIDRYTSDARKLIHTDLTGDFASQLTSGIKWTRHVKNAFRKRISLSYDDTKICVASYRPFVRQYLYRDFYLNEMAYQMPSIFPESLGANRTITTVVEPRADFSVLGLDALPNKDFFMPSAAQNFPRYRYTSDGERLDNITDWGLKQFEAKYGKGQVTKDDIFAYCYGVLHDPVYRETYALNLKRDFPRVPLYDDFAQWRDWGQRLLDLHIGYESVAPFAFAREETPDDKARAAGVSPRVILKSDPAAGIVTLDSETRLTGIPRAAWDYRLGNRSAIDWVLDQHKEKTPKDATIREKFNTYRFKDYKDKVIDLLGRVVTLSLDTVAITEAMKAAKR